jgi:hypothetical protein
MALTDAEKGEVLFYLGYPAITLVEGSTHYSKILADRLAALPDYAETRARKIMKKIRDIDVKLEEATERMSVKEVDGFQLNENEVQGLKGMRKGHVKELASLTGVSAGCSRGIFITL